MRLTLAACLLLSSVPAFAAAPACRVWEDADGNGRWDASERALPGIKVSDGRHVAVTDARGRYRLPESGGARTLFVIKPAGHAFALRDDGLPDMWYDIPDGHRGPGCVDFRLLPAADADQAGVEVLVFSDSQVKDTVQLEHFRRDIVDPLAGGVRARFGTTLGDLVDDNLALYPGLKQVMRQLGTPWLHVPGNHDLDFDAPDDAGSLATYRRHFGPDTFASEEPGLVFIGMDDVIYLPGQRPRYIGGFREDQFAFLEAYLPTVPKDALLVLGMHIPLFDAAPGVESFRHADRARLFGLLREFPNVLVLSGHSHTQQHHFHGADAGWSGARPLHEYNVGAACGAYWSGVEDAAGIPDATMADGTPNGHARLRVDGQGGYVLTWHPARLEQDDPAFTEAMALHAPRVLRRGAYPAWGVYANVFMGHDGTRVSYRIDGGEWQPMRKVAAPDPRLLAENVRDDLADALRGYDRSPEAQPSPHLWRGALATDLAVGTHRVEVRSVDDAGIEHHARIDYRLEDAAR